MNFFLSEEEEEEEQGVNGEAEEQHLLEV